MGEDTTSYTEPTKQRARVELLSNAVEALTTGRSTSPLVPAGEFDRLLDYCVGFIRMHGRQDLSEVVAPLRSYWHDVQVSHVRQRHPGELKVLFLSGPEPLNDLEQLAALGVSPHNIWAIEGDRDTFQAAAAQLRDAGMAIKLHWGSLQDFFAVVPEQFDVVYFDACGPLFGGKPRTNVVLQELFLRQRMAPLSVLITNFAATPRDKEEEWINRLFAWYAARFSQPVDHESEAIERVSGPNWYLTHLKEHLEAYYDDFVTRFTIEFANELLAWWRVRAFSAARRAYFAADAILDAAIAASLNSPESRDIREMLQSIGHAQLAPSQYPWLCTMALMRKRLAKNDALSELFFTETLGQARLSDGIAAISLVRNFFEGYVDWGAHNWQACSDDLRELLHSFQ